MNSEWGLWGFINGMVLPSEGSFDGVPLLDMENEYNTAGMGTTSIVVLKGMWVRDLAAIVIGKRLIGITLNCESDQSIVCRGQSMQAKGSSLTLKLRVDVTRRLKQWHQRSYQKDWCSPKWFKNFGTTWSFRQRFYIVGSGVSLQIKTLPIVNDFTRSSLAFWIILGGKIKFSTVIKMNIRAQHERLKVRVVIETQIN